jgi:DNA replication protein DnaC
MMLTQQTFTRLRSLKLDGMARAFEEQLIQPASHALTFEERFGLLVDREIAWRDTRRLERLLKQAHLKYPGACLEDLDTRAVRGLNARLMTSLAACDWVRAGQSVIATGAAGLGKSWLACALGQQACRQGFAVVYTRFSRLLEELRIAHGDGSFGRRLAQLAKADVLIVDDFALAPIGQNERCDLLEVLDDRTPGKSTIITSQLPVKHWHEYLAEPTLADAILDRLVHHSHRIELDGESLRKNIPEKGARKT